MNIHFATVQGQPERISSREAKAIGLTLRSGKGTEKPRTRPGQTYPGGKHLRSALARLAIRKKMHSEGAADHTMPGSMAA